MRIKTLGAALIALAALLTLAPAPAQETAAQAPPGDTPIVEIYTPGDASLVLAARLAALKTVVGMTPEQQKLWIPVDAAIRQAARNAAERRTQRASAATPETFVDLVDRAADAETARAADVKTVTAALRPFVASLSEAQRRRIPAFLGLRESDFGRAQPLAELWLFEDEQ